MIILFDNKKGELYIDTDLNNIIDKIYYGEVLIPNTKQINKSKDNNINKYFEKNGIEKGIKKIKTNISKINNKIPLYDIFSENLYLIGKNNVYDRVMKQHYRFPTEELFKELKTTKNDINNQIEDPIEKRKSDKVKLMIIFLESLDLEELYKTYMTVFYLYSEEVGKNISTCERPSFSHYFKHLKPYYSTNDIYNIALNMGITEDDIKKLTEHELCKFVIKNDINAQLLLDHQQHMIKNDKVGLVQYYTLQGSYFMNQYMRKQTSYEIRNTYLESIIRPMCQLVTDAPEFDNDYTVYRFIHSDSHLRHLAIGDIYIDSSFISTTRDPFYRSDLYKFGFILVKIKIPKNIKGVALCVETLSHFPEEQEIIFPPLTILRLDTKDDQCKYYHTDKIFCSQVKTRYEFTYVGKKDISFLDRQNDTVNENSVINFMKINDVETYTLDEKIRYFSSKHVNKLNQFIVELGGNNYTIITERYDSTSAYQKFYAISNHNGLLFYTIHNNYILFMIEIGETNRENELKRYMHVNFYVRYSTIDKGQLYSDDTFIRFISEIAFYFKIERIILWTDFKSCDIYSKSEQINTSIKQREFGEFPHKVSKINIKNKSTHDIPQIINGGGGVYCVDFYKYLKYGIKKYSSINKMEVHPHFLYYNLDLLKKTNPLKILIKSDQDEIYQIYDKIYIQSFDKTKHNISDLYIWLIENKCYLVDIFIEKMNRIFIVDNPFDTFYYVIDPITFLYNKHIINFYPTFTTRAINTYNHIIPKNTYRLT